MTCDDTCPRMIGNVVDPSQCGGVQTLTRTVIKNNNTYGIICPDLQRSMKCGQFKCAVDCVTSDWSAWSACTTDCGGGIRSRTRSILTKPRHGGQACDSTVETEVCNQGSCDR